MTYIDRLNAFHTYARTKNLAPSSRLLMLVILDKWNALRRPRSFVASQRDLARLSGLSLSRVHDALHDITRRQLVKLVNTGNEKEIFLPEKPTGTPDRTAPETSQNAGLGSSVSYHNSTNSREREEQVRPRKGERASQKYADRRDDATRQRVAAKAQEFLNKIKTLDLQEKQRKQALEKKALDAL